MNEREQITYTFEKTYNFKPVLTFQRKGFRNQKAGWYLRLGRPDSEKIYLGPDAHRALGRVLELNEETLLQAEIYANDVEKQLAAQWDGTVRGSLMK